MDNPFIADAAARYHRYRPYHHERTLKRAFEIATPAAGLALDVACGTGLSTMALERHGIRALGVDTSMAMLRVARSKAGVNVARAEAEHVPVTDASCSLLTCGSGLHWLDWEAFCHEARRVVVPGGLVIIYDHRFLGRSDQATPFAQWFQMRYLTRYPPPPRYRAPNEAQAPPGLVRIGDSTFTEEILLDQGALVGYLLTQSNTIVASASGSESLDETAAWLNAEIRPFFGDEHRVLGFDYWGRVQCLRTR